MLQKVPDRIAYCYDRAGQSRANAANCAEERDIQEHLENERCWLTLARSYELSERIGRFSDEVSGRRVRVLIPPEPPDPAIPIVRCSECGKRTRLAQIVPCLPASRRADTWTFTCECGFSCEQLVDRTHTPTRS
jgi:hypothetical protein